MENYIRHFNEISINDVAEVGGKNASLGEMFRKLKKQDINVPDGFATTAKAYWDHLDANHLREALSNNLDELDTKEFSNLSAVAKKCRELILSGQLPADLSTQIRDAYHNLTERYGKDISLAARSSATAEDLPNASFAGQQETYLNVSGEDHLLLACKHCYASLFTDRAVKYRVDNGFEHMKVALSVGIQLMVRSDLASSGVMFTLDPDSGFDKTVLISGAWGLGENVVQGTVNTDEYLVYKPFIDKVKNPVISRKLGSKEKTMIYTTDSGKALTSPAQAIINIDTPDQKKESFTLDTEEVIRLAKWAMIIEKHYGRHMDIEWAKDGKSGDIFIVQARPETVHSKGKANGIFREYRLKERSKVLSEGIGLGNRITSGKARILHSPSEIDKLQENEILVTGRTDPDWDPILKKASAIITDKGGRTSHAAIVAREVGAIAIVGTGDATSTITDGQTITVSAAEGDTGYVYEGELEWEEKETDLSGIEMPRTKPMLILGHPDQAFKYSMLPNEGVGLMRMEFIINNAIGIHPMALSHFSEMTDKKAAAEIEKRTRTSADKQEYFVTRLAEATAVIAAAFYPKDVIVRMSDFKSNEYANLLGGSQFEPDEENPMIGFRGASRYYHPLYKDGFALECKAMKRVREEMGFTNVKLMVPFCRTVGEAEKVTTLMHDNGLERSKDGLEIYMMVEIPSNALLIDEFSEYFDGFSIGSNDLTQLTLGADRDSTLLSEIFSAFDPAVMQLIRMSIDKARRAKKKIGLCGQAPSDYPDYARFLVECGIDSISFNPDALLKGIENILAAEK